MASIPNRSQIADRLARLSDARRKLVQLRLDEPDSLDSRVAAGPAKAPVRLIAYVVPRTGTSPTSDKLRRHLAERLPKHMEPATFVFQDHLPHTPNGKVDRRALREVASIRESGLAVERDGFVLPRNETEETLADIWRTVLGQDELSVHDNFFEVGGDSLLSIRILAAAHERGLRIAPERFFDHPTIAEQASIAGQVTDEAAREDSQPDRSGRGGSAGEDFPLAALDRAELDRVSQLIDDADESGDPAQ